MLSVVCVCVLNKASVHLIKRDITQMDISIYK